jgi:PPOX class probable FMN-dependent enzyme
MGMSEHVLSTQAELRELYGEPNPQGFAIRCVLSVLDPHHRAFIGASPFIVLGSADVQGRADVSPRGDLPGFVHVQDESTLHIPDRSGNKKMLTLSNLLENPSVSIIFFVPGRDDTLRVTGTAAISTDEKLLAPLAVRNNLPKSVLVVHVEQAWLHCGKSIKRSRLWDQEAQYKADDLPTLGQMLADQIEGVEAKAADEKMDSYYKTTLWSEPIG